MMSFAQFIPYIACVLAAMVFISRAQEAGNPFQNSLTFGLAGAGTFLIGFFIGNAIVGYFLDAICEVISTTALAEVMLSVPGALVGLGASYLAWRSQVGLATKFIRPPPVHSTGAAVESSSADDAGTSWIYDPKVRSIITQIVVVGGVALLLYLIVTNTAENLEKRGIASGFGFLCTPARYDVTGGFMEVASTETHWAAFTAGLLNTLLVAIFGCFAATVLGVIVGVLRLSKNWLVNKLAAVYIETLRNVPVLLQILFWYGIFILMPAPRQSVNIGDAFFFNNRSFIGPKTFFGDTPMISAEQQAAMIEKMGDVKYNRLLEQIGGEENLTAALSETVRPVFGDGSWIMLTAVLLAIIATVVFRKWARAKQEATGQQYPVFWISTGIIILFPLLCSLIGGMSFEIQYPTLQGFNFVGGASIPVAFIALWFALSTYTASFIAEIVRAGILAVPYGQTEASFALGLRSGVTMRLNILPQALRVIVPPLTSQYLNLTKNSSLALVVGYPDVVGTIGGITLNQTGQAVECIVITMAVYLTFSLLISVFMNWYNKRIALVER
jgi:general L-amino acid transport system permease protein